MSFNIAEAIDDATKWFLKAPAIKRVAKSSIATAAVITIIIILMVAFVYRDVESEEGRHILALRSGFWCLLIVLGLLHLHQKILETGEVTTTAGAELFAPVVIKSLID